MCLQNDLIRDQAPRFADYPQNVSRNLLKLKVFYMDFNCETVTEKPAYSVSYVEIDFFCN